MMSKPTIAIVGMACQFPGAQSPQQFWKNIKDHRNSATRVPEGRWIAPSERMVATGWQPDHAYSPYACLIDGFRFDPAGFRLDSKLLADLDPLHQITLTAGRQAFDTCRTQAVDLERTGVILAAIALPTEGSSTLARKLLTRALEKNLISPAVRQKAAPLSKAEALAAKVVSLPAALLAMELGLGGNAYTLDAACASSSYALKLACDELTSGRADMMITGGVSRPECLYTQVGFSQLKALSPSGRCAPFDAGADGLVVGEGAGILVLKRLSDALAHGDRIYSLIRGIGLSNDIRGNLLAPDTEGQLRAMRAAYAAAGWSPEEVDYIECHGTGTPTGDKVELESLCRLWEASGWEKGQCAIGSVKSMIGHLLTAASAAGLIKTLLAMQNDCLPPSLNFSGPAPNSPLPESPFRVQTRTEAWPQRQPGRAKRAAVSAFGFGGINAHVLLESFEGDTQTNTDKSAFAVPSLPQQKQAHISTPVAVVGMQTMAGPLRSLREFQEAVFNGETAIGPRPDRRWKGLEAAAEGVLEDTGLPGAYLDAFNIHVGEFQIPPNEIRDILPQQLLMLKTAAGAMMDAGMPLKQERTRMGAVMGITFDPEATNFHMRWALDRQLAQLSESKPAEVERLRDACGPSLNAPRTLGALGGIVASRIAREFRLGGPSFVVSAEEASGVKALEVAYRALADQEMDAVLVGGIDLCGDVRSAMISRGLDAFSKSGAVAPFDETADGALPGEGAVALVLKRLDDAVADQDRIYAVIRGVGAASAAAPDVKSCTAQTYTRSLERTLNESAFPKMSIRRIETHGSGVPTEDRNELTALAEVFGPEAEFDTPPLLGTVTPIIGHTGAAAGLFSVAKTCLELYHQIIAPVVNYSHSSHPALQEEKFHLPRFAHYWNRNRIEGPRRALAASMTRDGGCAHVALEEFDDPRSGDVAQKTAWERKRPLGMTPCGLFAVQGDDPQTLTAGLDELEREIRQDLEEQNGLERIARKWHQRHPVDAGSGQILTLAAKETDQLLRWIDQARATLQKGEPARISGPGGIAYTPEPLGRQGETAFVYPGSGNHYLGMGRKAGLHWPEVLRRMDQETERQKDQMRSHELVPTRSAWPADWEQQSTVRITADALTMIFGQVFHGSMMTHLLETFVVLPQAVIGYSLGQTAGYFATGAWPDRGRMLARMEGNPLFTTQLTGPCRSARQKWNIPEAEPFEWKVAVVNRSARQVSEAIAGFARARLLIVNTPTECVIGGDAPQVQDVIDALECDAVYLDGVVTVHCEVAEPVAQAYYDLHVFPTQPAAGVRYYSCAAGAAHELTRESAAEAILQQALAGFDFTETIASAYADGVRIFVELGPHASLSRMIRSTLEDRPHLAESICQRGEDDYFTVIKLLGNLLAQGVAVDLEALYGDQAYWPAVSRPTPLPTGKAVGVTVGGHCVGEALQEILSRPTPSPSRVKHNTFQPENRPAPPNETDLLPENQTAPSFELSQQIPLPEVPDIAMEDSPSIKMLRALTDTQTAAAKAHEQFLDLSRQLQHAMGEALLFQNSLLHRMTQDLPEEETFPVAPHGHHPAPAYSREMCMEFAVGSAARVLGPEFAEVDGYPVRVRLPDEPLMLVDRIMSVEGEKGSLTSGRLVTEHDVLPGAWYLDGNRAPVCISVEAGQADLFLCAYLGIDLKVKGRRAYRLLDATVCFHRGLPMPGETIRYEIRIDKFIRQQKTYLFFFNFEGYIGEQHLITMTNGCAGFFTPKEVENSGGILLTPAENAPTPGKRPSNWRPLASMTTESYGDAQIDALRRGDLAACFGPTFEGKKLAENLWLPGGRMHLLDRVTILESSGGRYGMGRIVAEADIHPNDWFLTCHFVDDMVMPGTLMYECCDHTLRILLQRMGWISAKTDVRYEPKLGIPARLKCRGPVTPATAKVQYEVVLKEIGYDPEPYAVADAHMYADGRHIVFFEDMSLKLSGERQNEIETLWQSAKAPDPPKAVFTRRHILEFAVGKPSLAFGESYRVFDQERVIARLPGPPFCFIDRITKVAPKPWVLKPDGWVEAQVDLAADDWFFTADRSGTIPFCVLLEIALQPCGWLAAYAGSALRSRKDLKFRNLGGAGTIHRNIHPRNRTLTMRTRLTKVSEAGEMIIENFDFEVLHRNEPIYSGNTYFGFFTAAALGDQKGLPAKDCGPKVDLNSCKPLENEGILKTIAPILPQDAEGIAPDQPPGLDLPAKALLMVDRITICDPAGGAAGLGYIRGEKQVDPQEWFFSAHFYQDPVCPGSLGVEGFLQLLKFFAKRQWQGLTQSHFFEMLPQSEHRWTYRGQIVPANSRVVMEAEIKRIETGEAPVLIADGWISVDGLYIYKMENFGLRLTPRN